MKKTQLKDTRRNISGQAVSYISIIVIAMLAVAAFLGINYSADALKDNASNFWKKLNFRDIEIISTMLLTEEDLDEIKKVEGVIDAEGVYQTTAQLFGEDENMTVDVISLTEKVSLPEMLEGRLPENLFECAAEKEIMERMGLKVGDTIKIGSGDGDCAPYLRHKVFFITGAFLHSDHYATETFSGGNRFLLVTDTAFDTAALEGCYMKAVVKMNVPDDMRLIGKDYDKLEAAASERMEALAEQRTPLRDVQVKEKYQKEIDEGESTLADAKKELDDGRRELDENSQKIADGEKELAEAKKKLDQAKKELEAAKKKLDKAKKELDANKPKLESAQAELEEAEAELIDGWNQIEAKKTEARNAIASKVDAYLPEGVTVSWAGAAAPNVNDPSLDAAVFRITTDYSINIVELTSNINSVVSRVVHSALDGRTNPETGEAFTSEEINGYISQITGALSGTALYEASDALSQWNDGHSEYIAGREEYLAAKKKYDDGLAAYEKGLADYKKGLAEYQRGLDEYNKALAELEDAKAQLAEGEEKYSEGSEEYEEGRAELQRAKDIVAGLHPCRWVVLDAACNSSYVHAKTAADNITKISMTFAMLFVLLGVLIIYTTIARIVGEQKKQLGTVKALGLFSGEAAVKYLFFGISGTVIGIALGILASYFLIQGIVIIAHLSFYVTETIPYAFNARLTGIVTVFGIVISALAVWFACAELVKKPAVQLMKDDMPVTSLGGSQKKDARSRATSLYSKLILRNIRTDSRRVAITIISVAGCCILLVIGFTVKDGIVNAINAEYNDIYRFDHIVTYDSETSETVEQDVKDILDENGIEYSKLHYLHYNINAGKELTDGALLCGDKEELTAVFNMTRPRTGKPVVPGDHGVCIMRRTAVYYGVGVGDTITIYDSAMEPHEVTVEGVFENYTGMYYMMTRDAYREIFREEPVDNAYFTRNFTDSEDVNEQLLKTQGVLGVEDNEVTHQESITASKAITLVTVALIIAAGVMAYFILLNLATMYINQKRRELTIMRINGYTTGEAIAYVAREAIVTTLLGIVSGIGIGSVFAYLILRFVEHRHAGFMLTPDYFAWGMSALITIIYSVIIYAIALRKVKDLKLTDIH